jgi:hypothetical protein
MTNPQRLPSPEEALRFVEAHGTVLESAHGPVPTFVDFVASEQVGRWWDHPLGRSIFQLTRVIRDSPDIVTCRLIDCKITYLHRRVWPAVVKLSRKFNRQDLAAIREEHLPNGSHRVIVTPFPEWVPRDIVTASKALSDREARAFLPNLKF